MALVGPIDTPDDSDDKTIDVQAGSDAPLELRMVPISKLPAGQQFDVLKSNINSDIQHSSAWREDTRFWFAFRAGEQWAEEDKALLQAQQRPVIVFNRVLTILKAVAGMEVNGRHEVQFIPRKTSDTKVNELLTAASKWAGDECDAEDEESEAFDDCATCGIGVTESRMSYEEDSAGLYVEEAVNPREFVWDRTANKPGLKDARRMARIRKMPIADAVQLFPGKTKEQLDAQWVDLGPSDIAIKSLEEKRIRTDNQPDSHYDDQYEVTLVHVQWYEKEPYWLVADEATNKKAEFSQAEYDRFKRRMEMLGMPNVPAVRLVRRVYKQAWMGSEMLQTATDSPVKGRFSWSVITGERDKSKGSFFGLVKIMRDPQMWANKWLSQILHILNTTAKGGIIAEEDAFDDQVQAEESYGKPDQVTWAAVGALSGQNPKIMPKPGQGISDGYLGLMTFAISSIKDVTGINLELLGQQDQNQPGILEAMRKQAGMTILATLFDSLRRFRKGVGRCRLYFIQNYLSDGRLIRVVGQEETQALPLIRDKLLGEYDVVVDDAPTSPNQKEANWTIIQPLLAIFKEQLMANPVVFAALLEYSPLPSRLVDMVKQFADKAVNDPQAQAEAQQMKQLQFAKISASINKDQSTAELNNSKSGATEATAIYDIGMAQHLLSSGKWEELKHHIGLMEAASKAKVAEAEAEHIKAKTDRERVGSHADAILAAGGHIATIAEQRREALRAAIEHLSSTAGAHRDLAAARKDHIIADRTARTPIPQPQPMGVENGT